MHCPTAAGFLASCSWPGDSSEFRNVGIIDDHLPQQHIVPVFIDVRRNLRQRRDALRREPLSQGVGGSLPGTAGIVVAEHEHRCDIGRRCSFLEQAGGQRRPARDVEQGSGRQRCFNAFLVALFEAGPSPYGPPSNLRSPNMLNRLVLVNRRYGVS